MNARSPVGRRRDAGDAGHGQDIRNVGDITMVDPNIHAGIKYMRLTRDVPFFKDEPLDEINRGLFTFAAYNAGPGRIRQLRRQAERRGLNPNVWFGNVEQIASERIGRETVTYVSNIYKDYVAYRLVVEEQERRAASQGDAQGAGQQVRVTPPFRNAARRSVCGQRPRLAFMNAERLRLEEARSHKVPVEAL